MDNDSMAILFIKCIIREPCRGSCDDAAYLKGGIEPLTKIRTEVNRVEINLPDNTQQRARKNNPECQAVVVGRLFQIPSDEPRRIFDTRILVQPGKPLLQVDPVDVDQPGQLTCIVFRDL